ncbi:hypothetical protein JQC67_17770 [Aurantibacter crassamenti]|uniref:hypothetical protein n=1 Tax=Aurantibacter crassamenti TaxID=1837375 RepID=UPI00193A32F1|nr:hypothetical protein [Aurantibacter crassamenti]MBM1108004.1 hypothetical protein [Aurantibacter crassamenti]
MRKFLLLLFATTLVIGACTDRDDVIGDVNIRIKNQSNLNFVKVEVSGTEESYENVASGDYSEYLEFETAYKYASIVIEADSTNYSYQPIDFVGEDSLSFGFYTYELNITEEGEVLLNFKVD